MLRSAIVYCIARSIFHKMLNFSLKKKMHFLFVFCHTKNTLTKRPSDKTQKGMRKDYRPCFHPFEDTNESEGYVWKTEWLSRFQGVPQK